jgi:hypothetical protein
LGDGTDFQPRVVQYTNFLGREPPSRDNTCIFPVVVDQPLFAAYLTDMVLSFAAIGAHQMAQCCIQ